MSVRPKNETTDSLYSNFDHVINGQVIDELLQDSQKFAQHAAWNFCGYVWHDERGWHNEVWCYGAPVEVISGDTPETVIYEANDKYGND